MTVGVYVFDFGVLSLSGGRCCVSLVMIEVVPFKPSKTKVSPYNDDQFG